MTQPLYVCMQHMHVHLRMFMCLLCCLHLCCVQCCKQLRMERGVLGLLWVVGVHRSRCQLWASAGCTVHGLGRCAQHLYTHITCRCAGHTQWLEDVTGRCVSAASGSTATCSNAREAAHMRWFACISMGMKSVVCGGVMAKLTCCVCACEAYV